MREKEKSDDLLTNILSKTELNFVSDLPRKNNKNLVLAAIREIGAGDYGVVEWDEAAAYILGSTLDGPDTPEKAKETLISVLASSIAALN